MTLIYPAAFQPKELKVELSLRAEPEVKIVNGTHTRSGDRDSGLASYCKPRKRNAASCSDCEEREKMLTGNEEPTRPKSLGNLRALGAEKHRPDKGNEEFVHSGEYLFC